MTVELTKILIALILGTIVTVSLTSCGLTTPNGYTLGTTSYLKEANRVQLAKLTPTRAASIGAIIPKHLQAQLGGND